MGAGRATAIINDSERVVAAGRLPGEGIGGRRRTEERLAAKPIELVHSGSGPRPQLKLAGGICLKLIDAALQRRSDDWRLAGVDPEERVGAMLGCGWRTARESGFSEQLQQIGRPELVDLGAQPGPSIVAGDAEVGVAIDQNAAMKLARRDRRNSRDEPALDGLLAGRAGKITGGRAEIHAMSSGRRRRWRVGKF